MCMLGAERVCLDAVIQSSVAGGSFCVIDLESLYLSNLFILAYLLQHLMMFCLNTNLTSSE